MTPRHVASTTLKAVHRQDIVLTGCGRVYLFPPTMAQEDRLAGIHHPLHRIGYVEPVDGRWEPRGLHDRPVAPPSSRTEALYQVVTAAGHVVARSSLAPRLACVGTTRTFGAQSRREVGVFLDQLGTVFLGTRRTAERQRPHLTARLGTLWLTGDRIATLGTGQASDERTLHRTYRAAIASLLKQARSR